MNKPEDSQNEAPPEIDQLRSLLKALEEQNEQIQPLIDFHKAMESAKEDDIRMFWDVKIVRGEDTPFASVQGSSSMPDALARKMAPLTPGNIQKEVSQKIVEPLISAVLDKLVKPEVENLSEP
ncbi:MAG: hypothetical protein WD342_16190 [Verrucomicrobiales bacterium]